MRDAIDLQALLRHPFSSKERMLFRRRAKGLPRRGSHPSPLGEQGGKVSEEAARYQIEREQLRIEVIRNLMAAKIREER
jgi:hypothetical protein